MRKISKGAMNYYGFSKPTPTHKRVKSSIYNPSPLNRNTNTQMEVVKGFGYAPSGQNPLSRQKDTRSNQTKSRKKYREGSSESNISNSYFKSFDSKRIKKKKKIKKVLPGARIHANFN